MSLKRFAAVSCVVMLAGCAGQPGTLFPPIEPKPSSQPEIIPAPVIRQPVLPEMLVNCRGHVLVPALGMTFVHRGAQAPATGQFMREENLTPPYRIVAPGDRMTMEFSPQRLNVELDSRSRVVGLYCG